MRALLAVAAATLLTVVLPGEAAAAVDFPPMDPATVDTYRLTPGTSFDQYGERITALETQPQLAPKGVPEVIASANRTARPLCHETHLDPELEPGGFCWQDGEDDAENTWVPQGVTGSGDADPASGTVDGRKIVLASWHTRDDMFIRVSFVDVTDPARMVYRHVLLVEPTSNDDFDPIAGHGHGLTWRGDRLFVATTGGQIRVFDLGHIWEMDPGSGEVGLGANGKYHARWHSFALPQVGAYTYPGGAGCANGDEPRPCLATLAFDHSGPGSVISAEHIARGADGRIVRWPFDSATGLLKTSGDGQVHATEGYRSPVWAVQGAVAHDGYILLTGACPENAGKPGDLPACLHGGIGGTSISRLTTAPVNAQNLSHWPATGELWLLGEQLRERVTVRVPWSALTGMGTRRG